MKYKIKSILCLMLSTVLFSTFLLSCSSLKGSSNSKKGRYVEKEIKLTKDIKNNYIFKLDKDDKGMPVLYGSDRKGPIKREDSTKGIYKFTLKEDGNWDKEVVSWLKDIIVTHIYDSQLIFGADGNEYFVYRDQNTDGTLGNINFLKKTSDSAYSKINLEGYDTNPPATTPKFAVLKNGNIVADNVQDQNVNIYDKSTFKLLSTVSSGNGEGICAYDDKFIVTSGKDDEINSVSFYNNDNKEEKKVKFEAPKKQSNTNMNVCDDDSIVIANGNGISKLNKDSNMWETIVDGSLTNLMSPQTFNMGIVENKNKDYYIYYNDTKDNPYLMKYTYDKDICAKPEKELSIYSIDESYTIEQAIIEYQRSNPDTKVNYRYQVGLFDTAQNKNDYIKTLNTELLSGKGADIIILDGLPVQSYVDKGVLKDLTDFVKPKTESKELLPNIIDKCKINDKNYYIPARFTMPSVYGNTGSVNELTTLDKTAKYCKGHKGEGIFGVITYDDLVKQYLSLHLNDFYSRDKGINEAKLKDFLNKLKVISDGNKCVDAYTEDRTKKSDGFDLASKAKAVMKDSKGIFDSIGELCAVKYVNGSFESYENKFTPITNMGINAASKNTDEAEKFIETVLSPKVQDEDFVDGISVTDAGLKSRENCNDYGLITVMQIENSDGSMSDFDIAWPDKQRLNKFIKMCRSVSVKTENDTVIESDVEGEAVQFLQGKKDVSQTVNDINKKCKTYIDEQK